MAGLGYTYQSLFTLIGTKSGTTRSSIALTAAYDVSNKTKIFETGGMSKANFSILYTTGTGETSNSIDLRIETSSDRTNWYRIPNEAVSTGTSTLTAREFIHVGGSAATAYPLSLPLDLQDEYMRISVKETGVSSNFGTVYVEVILSGGK